MPKIPDIAIEATSTIAGAGAAYQAGDPSAGYAVREFLNNGLRGLLNHFSSQRQSKRITDVTEFALNEIRQRLEDGEKLRDDGFFDKTIEDRCDAEEVLEAVLLKARDEPEEKKTIHIGGLFENGCFDSKIDSSTLHFLCKESENLTYQQLCIIKIVNEKNKKKYSFRKTSLRSSLVHDHSTIQEIRDNLTPEKFSVLLETIALGGKGYIMYDCVWTPQLESDVIKLLAPDTIEPLPAGEMLYEYMNLKLIPEEDVLPIVEALS